MESTARHMNKVELLILALETRVKSLEIESMEQRTITRRMNWALHELEAKAMATAEETIRKIRAQQQFQGIGDGNEDG